MKVSHAALEATLPADMEVSCSSSAPLVELLQLFGSLLQFGRCKIRERGNDVCTPTSTRAAALAKLTPEYEKKSVMDPEGDPPEVILTLRDARTPASLADKHATDVSDIHVLLSPLVPENCACSVFHIMPNPDPPTVIEDEPVAARLQFLT